MAETHPEYRTGLRFADEVLDSFDHQFGTISREMGAASMDRKQQSAETSSAAQSSAGHYQPTRRSEALLQPI
jgi:hypothetical protein